MCWVPLGAVRRPIKVHLRHGADGPTDMNSPLSVGVSVSMTARISGLGWKGTDNTTQLPQSIRGSVLSVQYCLLVMLYQYSVYNRL